MTRRTEAEQAAVDRDGPTCRRCHRNLVDIPASKHHRKKRRFLDADRVANIVILCGTGTTGCHGWCHSEPAAAHDAGWVCWSWETPAERPLHDLYGGVLMLLDDGTAITDPPIPESFYPADSAVPF
jgi:hypothetical protein